jgi:sortase A
VAHFGTSGNPGDGRNIVLIGHNNTLGEVFRYLDQLHLGDQVTLYTEERAFEYKVQKKFIIPYLGAEEAGDALLVSYSAPQLSEMITIISCWPYFTNAHRIVIIAVPVSNAEGT